jgi:hypothetical protein
MQSRTRVGAIVEDYLLSGEPHKVIAKMDCAPAIRRALAALVSVAPVVVTSSTITTVPLNLRLAVNAPARFAARWRASKPT